jgi:hypothetical protein
LREGRKSANVHIYPGFIWGIPDKSEKPPAMRITANGISFNVQIDGPEGAPWVIFSNSVLTNLTMWKDQAADLQRSFRVLRYDQRGHGSTDVTDGKYSFDLLVADVVALMDALSIQRAHFVGLSMGGITALFLAPCPPVRPCHRLRLRARLDASLGAAMERAQSH